MCYSDATSLFSLFAPELVVEVVSERGLNPIIVILEAVVQVISAAPLKLAAHHDVLGRVMKQVDDAILSQMKVRRELQSSVVDSQV